MALVATAAAVIGLITYSELSDPTYRKMITREIKNSEKEQILDDYDIGILTNSNVRGAASLFSEELGGIIRSNDPGDIYSVRENALEYSSQARIKNKALGETNFDPKNRRTVQVPSYGSAITHVTIPNPSVFPGYEKIPNAWVDRKTPDVLQCDRASNYREPFGELITPFNLPRDTINMDTKFGNPWGPAGVFNKNFRDGGRRLDGKSDSDPFSYTQRRVSFNPNPNIHKIPGRQNSTPYTRSSRPDMKSNIY